MRRALPALLLMLLGVSACTTTQVYKNPGASFTATDASRVAVLYSAPSRPYEVIGLVSAKRYKPGFSDPSVLDAIPGLRQAGAEVGADAVIVRDSRSQNTRITTIEAEAIRYTDGAGGAATPATAPAATSGCEACKKIGG